MKTWHCVLFSILVHGLIFAIPVRTEIPQVNHPEEIQLMVLNPPPPVIPAEKTPEPVAAPQTPRLPEPQRPPAPRIQQAVKKPESTRKRPVQVKKTVVPTVSPVQPEMESLTKNMPEAVIDDSSPQETPPVTEELPLSSSPSNNAPGATDRGAPAVQAAQPVAVSTVGVSGGAKFINQVLPRYPRLARRFGREGVVLLRLTIDSSGKLIEIEVIEKAENGFDEAAVEAVKRSSFSPAIRNGQPVECLALLKIAFQLSNE